MVILLPAALALIALTIPIVIFYMLRLRREGTQCVSSSMLWRGCRTAANAPWQRFCDAIFFCFIAASIALITGH